MGVCCEIEAYFFTNREQTFHYPRSSHLDSNLAETGRVERGWQPASVWIAEVAQFDSATMKINACDPQKTEGFDGRSGRTGGETTTVLLRTGNSVDVADCSWTDDNSVLIVFLHDQDRVDARVPREHVEMIIESNAGREVFCNDE